MNVRLDPGALREQLMAGNLTTVLTRYSDLMLAGLVMAILAILIIPLPPWVLDLFLAANITLSVTVMMTALYIPNALALAAFPSILLVTTLFRLGLNVASTRLILIDGYAGEVIQSFGKFVIKGEYVVGFVIFLIITIIQFIVVAKGAERVSEVSARFTLDALPGKQMSIDADLRAGIIDVAEARQKRDQISQESQFYGAMDGAMKFVKGDAIAGIIIAIINIAAGFAIGILNEGMTFAESARHYTLLTVGDGLVAQIPSLLIATAAGIITTRVASSTGEQSSLGREIGVQILAQPKAIAISAGLLFVLALVPGLPTVPFMVLSVISASLAWGVSRTQEKKSIEAIRAEVMGKGQNGQDAPRLPLAVPVILETSPDVTRLVDVQVDGTRFIQELIPQMRDWLFTELGVLFPGVRVQGDAAQLPEGTYVVFVNEVPVMTGHVYPERRFLSDGLDQAVLMGIEGIEAETPNGEGKGWWIPAEDAERLPHAGALPMRADEYMAVHLAHVLRKHVDQLLGIQDVQNMLDLLENQGYGALVASVVPELVSLPRLTEILKRLLREEVSIRNMRAILEVLAEWARFENDPVYLTEHIRIGLKAYIAHRFGKGRPVLSVYLLDPRIEKAIREGIRQSPSGSSLALEPEISRVILDAFAKTFGAPSRRNAHVLVLTQMEVRYFVKRLLDYHHSNVTVLSFQELPSDLQIQPIGRVTLPAMALAEEALSHA